MPASIGWDDIGDFASLATILGSGKAESLEVITGADHVISVDSTGIVAADSGRAVAIVGLDDIVVIDTADALLVTTKDRAQDVKRVVDELTGRGLTELT